MHHAVTSAIEKRAFTLSFILCPMNEQQIAAVVARLQGRPSDLSSDDYLREAVRTLVDADGTMGGVPADQFADNPGRSLASLIDHTVLKPEATEKHIRQLCAEADEYGFAAVCINPCFVTMASAFLQTSQIKVCSVVGFPLGVHCTRTKVMEAERAIADGAQELDMVINVGMVKAGRCEEARHEISEVVAVAGKDVTVKVILECGLLTDKEKVAACEVVIDAGAGFVKTSTGFLGRGATTYDVALLRRTARGRIGIKAAGGVRTTVAAAALVFHGATRLGCSASVAIVGG